mmetsp:Transcript_6411/g.14255  ORF Transcript_6411/g.14255 Transcript_6411/m.14255 type:complete len:204 (-) Transcript_6411:1583-2194(-)
MLVLVLDQVLDRHHERCEQIANHHQPAAQDEEAKGAADEGLLHLTAIGRLRLRLRLLLLLGHLDRVFDAVRRRVHDQPVARENRDHAHQQQVGQDDVPRRLLAERRRRLKEPVGPRAASHEAEHTLDHVGELHHRIRPVRRVGRDELSCLDFLDALLHRLEQHHHQSADERHRERPEQVHVRLERRRVLRVRQVVCRVVPQNH